MIVAVLPFPPPVNNLFANGKKGGGRYPTKRYEAWRARADEALLGSGRINGPFEAHMLFTRPDKVARDIDNLAKAPLDSLVRMGVIDDDSLAQRLTMEWAEGEPVGRKNATVTVTLRAWGAPIRAHPFWPEEEGK